MGVQSGDGVQWRSLGIGAAIQVFEVSTLGQPLEVLKTQMAAHRGDSLRAALRRTLAAGGPRALWRGLVPWAWIEAGTKGGVLLFAASETERLLTSPSVGLSRGAAGVLAGMAGGLAQAYTTVGFCTCMKTVEITRSGVGAGSSGGTLAAALAILRRDGIAGIYRGVSAVALRQMTNWGSRLGIARVAESLLAKRSGDSAEPLDAPRRLAAAAVAGALGCWNQPLEVLRVEMQRTAAQPGGARLSLAQAARRVYADRGLAGFYRGATPRIALSVYLTVCMVFGGDQLRAFFSRRAVDPCAKAPIN